MMMNANRTTQQISNRISNKLRMIPYREFSSEWLHKLSVNPMSIKTEVIMLRANAIAPAEEQRVHISICT